MRYLIFALLLIPSIAVANPAIFLKNVDMEWVVSPDGHKACLKTTLVDLETEEVEDATLCWLVPKKFLLTKQS